MFYASEILSRKGPLSHVWLAAHMDRKLSKTQVVNTRIPDAVADILNPTDKLALRLSSHLMLGVVKIYQRKAQYLLVEAGDAVYRIKTAFRQGDVDLPLEHRVAAFSSITMTGADSGVDLAVLLRVQAPEASFAAFAAVPAEKSLLLNLTPATLAGRPSLLSLERSQTQQTQQQRARSSVQAGGFGFSDVDETMDRTEASVEVGRDAPADREVPRDGDAVPEYDGRMFADAFMDYDKAPMTPPRMSAGGADLLALDGRADDAAMDLDRTLPPDAEVPVIAPPSLQVTPAAARKRKAATLFVDESVTLQKTTYRQWLDNPEDLLRPAPSAAALQDEAAPSVLSTPGWLDVSLLAPRATYVKRRAVPMYQLPVPVPAAAAAEDDGVPQLLPPAREPERADDHFVLNDRGGFDDAPMPGTADVSFADHPFGGADFDLSTVEPNAPMAEPAEEAPPVQSSTAQTEQIAVLLTRHFEAGAHVLSVQQLLIDESRRDRRAAAGLFYQLLELKTAHRVRLQQDAPYSDIRVSPLPHAVAV